MGRLLKKLDNQGNFTLPIKISERDIAHALCDFGASINLIPLYVFKALGPRESCPIDIILLLVYKFHLALDGVFENVIIGVGTFIILTNFIILDFEVDARMSIILGRPFLDIGGALIDVKAGKIMMRLYDEEMTFTVYNASSAPSHYGDLCKITTISSKAKQPKIPLFSLQHSIEIDLKIKGLFYNPWESDCNI